MQNPANKGIYGLNVPPYFDYYDRGGSIAIARQVEQEQTQKFANANAIRKSTGGQNKNRQTFPGKNKNIVYDSKDYVYRSEEKEPDKLTTDEIAFEITTRKFKEMGFEGIINWVQNIAKEEQVFDQMITALKKEKKKKC